MNKATCSRALVSVLGLFAALVGIADAQPGRGPAPVVVTEVIEREVSAGQKFMGTVMPMRRCIVGSAVDGRVLHMHVDLGDPVAMEQTTVAAGDDDLQTERGQPLAQLRTKTIDIQIAAARAELEALERDLDRLKASLPQQIRQAKARRLAAEALMQYSDSKYGRIQDLYKKGTVTQDEVDEAYSSWIAAQQTHDASVAAVDELEATREAVIAQADAKRLAQHEEVARLEDMRAKYTIRAPFAGYVVAKFTEVGQWIQSGDPVFEIVELDPVEVRINVPEAHLAKLQEGMERAQGQEKYLSAQVRTSAAGDRLFEGEVTRIVPQADVRSRSFPVRVRVKNPAGPAGHALSAGMLAQVTLPVGTTQPVLLVPKDTLVLGGRTPTVFVAETKQETKQTTVRPVSVEIGASFDSLIEVRGELKAGQQVVVLGNERLRPGQEVTIQEEGKSKK